MINPTGRQTGKNSDGGASEPSAGLRRGFTLIELLVVIAILAILGGILFPVLSRARESAKRAKCLSNLKQLTAAWTMYADDNKGRACIAYYQSNRIMYAWDFNSDKSVGLLGAYTRDGRLNACPSFKGQSWDRPFTGYAYNTTYIGGDGRMVGRNWVILRPPCLVSEIRYPAGTVVFADCGFDVPIKAANFLRAPSDELFRQGTVHYRHAGFACVAYADGHVAGVSKKYLPDPDIPDCGALSEDDSAYDLD